MEYQRKGDALTAEERAFLQQLFREGTDAAGPVSDEPHRSLTLMEGAAGADDGAADLVSRILTRGGARLRVADGDRILEYTLELDPDSAGSEAPRLYSSTPVVLDRYGSRGSIRVAPAPGEIEVHDRAGLLRRPDVVDLSTTGMFLRDHPDRAPADGTPVTGLKLSLNRDRAIRVSGRVVRVSRGRGGTGVAVAFDPDKLDAASAGTLRRYVYDCYRRHAG